MTISLGVYDQFGFPLPDVARQVNSGIALDPTSAPLNSTVTWPVSDNPRAGRTTREAAEILGKAERTVVAMCLSGTLRAIRYPARWRIPDDELRRHADGGGAHA